MNSTELGKQVAVKYGELSGVKEAALDPSTVLTFVSLISQIIEMFKSCRKTPAQAVQTIKNPGVFQRVALRRAVKEEMGGSAFRSHGDNVMAALHKKGVELTEADIQELYNEEG